MKTSIILCFIGILFGVNVTSTSALFFGMPGPIGKLADDIANKGLETKLKLLEKTEERVQQTNSNMATARSAAQSKILDGIQKSVLLQNNGQITKGNNQVNNMLRRLINIRDCYNRKQKQSSEEFQRIMGDTIKKCLAGHMDRGKKEMDKNQKNMEKANNNNKATSDCNNSENKSECLKNAISNVHERLSKLPQRFAENTKLNANTMTTMRLNMFGCVKDIGKLIAKRIQDVKQIIEECKAEALATTTDAADETTTSASSTITTAASDDSTTSASSTITTAASDETTTAATVNETTTDQSTSETSDITSTTTQQSDGVTTATESVTATDSTTVTRDP